MKRSESCGATSEEARSVSAKFKAAMGGIEVIGGMKGAQISFTFVGR
jgi:hypothetical protein